MGRRGFTMIEMAMVFTIIAIMAATGIPRIGRIMQSNRVNSNISTIASDMEQAFSISARFRRPMRISCDCANGIYTVADVAGGTVRLRRAVVGDQDLGNMTLTFDATVDVFPRGVSTAPLTVRITSGTSTRAVTLSTAGQVRIVP
jgi:prepilin-type N-terminal cleavage/methylation domain-containing protein